MCECDCAEREKAKSDAYISHTGLSHDRGLWPTVTRFDELFKVVE